MTQYYEQDLWTEVKSSVITWSDAYFDDVGTSEDQLFHHFSCHHVSCLSNRKKVRFYLFPVLIFLSPQPTTLWFESVSRSSFTDHYVVGRKLLPHVSDKVNKVFGVAVCHVDADILELRHRLQDGWQLLKVSVSGPRADGDTLGSEREEGVHCRQTKETKPLKRWNWVISWSTSRHSGCFDANSNQSSME